ncbi:MAG TPA: phosphatase PAP2 family protein [Rhizobiaceae bacterium]|nr:phosphatase PAP2 family protein [Rhizobiaceae bacterium]
MELPLAQTSPSPETRKAEPNTAVRTALRAWLERFYGNVISAIDFARRRQNARIALRARGKNWWRFALFAVLALIFASALFDPVFGAQGAFGPRWLQSFGAFAAEYGKSGYYIVPLALGLIWVTSLDWSLRLPRPKLLLFYRAAAMDLALISIAGSGIIASVLKLVVGRARPHIFEQVGAFHFEPFAFEAMMASFPSGHATTFGAVCAAVALLFPRLRILALLIAVWFGFSRVIVGVHYPSDVIAGLLFGYWFTQVTAYRFGKAGLIFDLPAAGGLKLKRSFHLVEARRHRRLKARLARWDARLHRVIGAPGGN